MSWKDRVEAYRSSGSSAEKLADDNTARKILKGLGWAEKDLDRLCGMLGLRHDPDTSQLDRALDVLDSVSGGLFSQVSPTRQFIVSRRKIGFSKGFWSGATADQLFELARGVSGGLLLFHMKPGEDKQHKNYAVVIVKEGFDVGNGLTAVPDWLVRPTAMLCCRRDGMAVWIRETEDLIRDMAVAMQWNIPGRDTFEA